MGCLPTLYNIRFNNLKDLLESVKNLPKDTLGELVEYNTAVNTIISKLASGEKIYIEAKEGTGNNIGNIEEINLQYKNKAVDNTLKVVSIYKKEEGKKKELGKIVFYLDTNTRKIVGEIFANITKKDIKELQNSTTMLTKSYRIQEEIKKSLKDKDVLLSDSFPIFFLGGIANNGVLEFTKIEELPIAEIKVKEAKLLIVSSSLFEEFSSSSFLLFISKANITSLEDLHNVIELKPDAVKNFIQANINRLLKCYDFYKSSLQDVPTIENDINILKSLFDEKSINIPVFLEVIKPHIIKHFNLKSFEVSAAVSTQDALQTAMNSGEGIFKNMRNDKKNEEDIQEEHINNEAIEDPEDLPEEWTLDATTRPVESLLSAECKHLLSLIIEKDALFNFLGMFPAITPSKAILSLSDLIIANSCTNSDDFIYAMINSNQEWIKVLGKILNADKKSIKNQDKETEKILNEILSEEVENLSMESKYTGINIINYLKTIEDIESFKYAFFSNFNTQRINYLVVYTELAFKEQERRINFRSLNMGSDQKSIPAMFYHEGKMYPSFVYTSSLHRILTILNMVDKGKRRKELEKLHGKLFFVNLLGNIFSCKNPIVNKKIEFARVLDIDGTSYDKMSKPDLLKVQLALYFSLESNKYFIPTVLSDKKALDAINLSTAISTDEFLNFLKYEADIAKFLISSNTDIDNFSYKAGENKENLKKILKSGEVTKENALQFLPLFPSIPKIGLNNEIVSLLNYLLFDKEAENIGTKLENILNEYAKLEIQTLGSSGFDVTIAELCLPLNSTIKDLDIENFLKQQFMVNKCFTLLTLGSELFFKNPVDIQKRASAIHSNGTGVTNSSLLYKGKQISDEYRRTVYIKDAVIETPHIEVIKSLHKNNEQLQNSFTKINATDALAYVTLLGYRKISIAHNLWSNEAEELYKALKKAFFNFKEDPNETTKEGILNLLTTANTIFQVRKPFVNTLTPIDVEATTEDAANSIPTSIGVPLINKNSEALLLSLLTSGVLDEIIQNGWEELSSLYTEMFKYSVDHQEDITSVDVFLFESAVKAGGRNKIINAEDFRNKLNTSNSEESNISENPYIIKYPINAYIDLQKVPVHFTDHYLPIGSLVLALGVASLEIPENSFIELPITKEKDEKGLKVPKKYSTTLDFIIDYFNTLLALEEKILKKLLQQFGIDNDTIKEIENLFAGESDIDVKNALIAKEKEKRLYQKLSTLLENSLLADSKPIDPAVLEAIQYNPTTGRLNSSINSHIINLKVQQVFFTAIKKALYHRDIKGGPLVQMSGASIKSDRKCNINMVGKKGEKILTKEEWQKSTSQEHESYEKYIESFEGKIRVTSFEAYIPCPSSSLARKLAAKNAYGLSPEELINKGIINKDDLAIIELGVCYRIPTENIYSVIPMKIKGFLPSIEGTTIILPDEITCLTGSDFDIDKMYVMVYDYFVNKEDNIVLLKNSKEANKIVEMLYASLTSYSRTKLLLNAGGFDKLENLVNKKIKETSENNLNQEFGSLLTRINFMNQNFIGKSLIGVFAVNNVSHIFLLSEKGWSASLSPSIVSTIQFANGTETTTIDAIKDRTGENNILDNTALYLAASADATKNPVLAKLFIDLNTAGAVAYLTRRGATLKDIVDFFGDLKITEILSEYSLFQDSYKPSLIDWLKENKNWQDLPKDNIISLITEGKEKEDLKKTLYYILKDALSFRNLVEATKINSKGNGIGPTASEAVISKQKFKNSLTFLEKISNEDSENKALKAKIDYLKTLYLMLYTDDSSSETNSLKSFYDLMTGFLSSVEEAFNKIEGYFTYIPKSHVEKIITSITVKYLLENWDRVTLTANTTNLSVEKAEEEFRNVIEKELNYNKKFEKSTANPIVLTLEDTKILREKLREYLRKSDISNTEKRKTLSTIAYYILIRTGFKLSYSKLETLITPEVENYLGFTEMYEELKELLYSKKGITFALEAALSYLSKQGIVPFISNDIAYVTKGKELSIYSGKNSEPFLNLIKKLRIDPKAKYAGFGILSSEPAKTFLPLIKTYSDIYQITGWEVEGDNIKTIYAKLISNKVNKSLPFLQFSFPDLELQLFNELALDANLQSGIEEAIKNTEKICL